MTRKVENKRLFNLKNIYPESGDLRDDIDTSKAIAFNSSATGRLMTIPLKVRQK